MNDLIVGLIVLYLAAVAIPHFLKRNLPGLLRYYQWFWIFCIIGGTLIWMGQHAK
jgi:uncharacterized membrane protein YhdT